MSYSEQHVPVYVFLLIFSLGVVPVFSVLVDSSPALCPRDSPPTQSQPGGCMGVSECPVMPASPELLDERQMELEKGSRAEEGPAVMGAHGDSPDYYSLVDHLSYIPEERDQGLCGNCWVWAGTGVMEVALSVQEGVDERLSIQCLNSCYNNGTGEWACCGGNLGSFASYYDDVGYAIPWSNGGAGWMDGGRLCMDGSSVSCGAIDCSPNYTVSSVDVEVVSTHGVSREEAVGNIKSVLHGGRAVYFSFFLCNFTRDFHPHWLQESESEVWTPDGCTNMTRDGGGHAVLCIGYSDVGGYWIMVNSWGTAGGNRPNGVFLLDMDVDYNSTFWHNGNPYWSYGWETLDVQYDVEPPTAEAGGPYTGVEGTPITLNATASTDCDGTIECYHWDWDGDGVHDESTTTPTINHTWSDDYNGTIGLMVVDSQGLNDTDVANVTVANQPPTVDAGLDETIRPNQTVYFNGSYTDAGNDTHTILWSFGDGESEAGNLTPAHTYSCQEGTYNATLNVTDDDGGWSTDVVTVTCVEPLISNYQRLFTDARMIYPSEGEDKPLDCAPAMVSDWLASAFIYTKLEGITEGLDTESAHVNQTTGEPQGCNGTGVISFGGPLVNPVVKRAESNDTAPEDRAPIRFHDEDGVFSFQHANGTPIPDAELPLSVINEDEDMFLIEVYRDGGGRCIMLCYGFGWKGTYAAGKYLDTTIHPDVEDYPYGWMIVKWVDSNGNGFVNTQHGGDDYTIIDCN